MLEAAKRVTTQKIKKRKVLSLCDLNKVFVKLNQNKTNLANQFAFCSFMRFNEGSILRRSDFIFSSTYVTVFTEKSKTEI